MAVLDDYQRVALEYGDWERLGPDLDVTVFDRNLALEDAKVALAPYDVLCLMRERMALPSTLIEALPNLRLVIFTGVRTRSIEFAALAERGIVACHTGGGEMQPATAELTWGLILAAMRYLPREMAGMWDGAWQTTVGSVLEGRTLGLLGLGKLRQRVAAIGAAFGMHRIAWSPNLDAERAGTAGVALVDKDELFAASDVLTLHMVLSPATRHLVGARELGLMRPGALLVNTSRGPLIDETALIETLRTGRIRGAALDVYDQEPLPVEHPLRTLVNAYLKPHLGYVTEGSYRQFFHDVVAAIAAWQTGAPINVASGS
ncbi:D-2-hydroxyacid dehydrogenase family protein [Methylobacterium sp. 092160098-2]|uniref:D-2-hydroxyacid dehydrogenase family protein n=1 Tax=Methylobacterium sp. 092160098-2 TaxID=3025129 RepID=UPI002381BD51|nr:D-2-hydroxyacid dehydrogenase family protein [Methylobacterium sp. 092160098-2]MDE4915164.1 D-2-hydroxyacid dehydrogenase family protein [Methylobacterium sp. 092160098-2]